ncbi:MAG: hypothetical protein ACRD3N_01185 [Terracidiphilus sp.]
MVTNKPKLTAVTDPPAKTGTELEQRIRSQSFTDAVLAVEWLNAAKGTAAYRRALAVRTELEEYRAELDRHLVETAQTRVLKVRDQVELATRADNLDRLLSGYRFKPEMNYSFGTRIWALEMVPVHPRGPQIEVRGQGLNYMPRRIVVSEPVVIVALARLAANRELYKVRLCETCGKNWRVSERKMDRFCSQKCRETFHAKSPDYHERKAANQRRYRENLKQATARGLSFK